MTRPPWANRTAQTREYFDNEWGFVTHTERQIFESLSLLVFQAGLAWATVLAKRGALRELFANFDIDTLATWSAADTARLMNEPSGIRNEQKIRAVLTNARAAHALRNDGGLVARVLMSTDPTTGDPWTSGDERARVLARDLRRAGFTFIGPHACRSLLETVGEIPPSNT
ncbi:MAG: DNA-3-methyladenine glycosylase I [Actinomycetaceae bacterium]|nr:DNA-3-methyladenine glycosylase I [Actinomycetaceae bacterium]